MSRTVRNRAIGPRLILRTPTVGVPAVSLLLQRGAILRPVLAVALAMPLSEGVIVPALTLKNPLSVLEAVAMLLRKNGSPILRVVLTFALPAPVLKTIFGSQVDAKVVSRLCLTAARAALFGDRHYPNPPSALQNRRRMNFTFEPAGPLMMTGSITGSSAVPV